MTFKHHARNAVSLCGDIGNHNDSFSYRPAALKDSARLAELFQTVYGNTTHPCQSPGYIRDSLMSGLQLWLAGLRHIAPWYARAPGAEVISQHLYPALGLEARPGTYPQTCLSGPASLASHGQLLYSHDPDNSTLTLSGQAGGYLPQPRALAEIISLLRQSPDLQYVCVQILADKLELLAGLIGLGFAITAYLPAWHLEGGARYDCIQLVLQSFASRPRSHGFDDQVTFFDLAYAQLAKRLCGLRLAQAHA